MRNKCANFPISTAINRSGPSGIVANMPPRNNGDICISYFAQSLPLLHMYKNIYQLTQYRFLDPKFPIPFHFIFL